MSDKKYISPEHAIRNIMNKKVTDTDNLVEEAGLEEGWYNPKDGKTYASKAESMAAAKQIDAAKASGAIASNQNAAKPKVAPPAAAPKPVKTVTSTGNPNMAGGVAPTKAPPTLKAPKGTPIKTGAKFAAGWGVVPAIMGAVQRGTEAYAQGKGNLEIAGETALGGKEGLAAGLSSPLAAAANAGEAVLKTVGLVKPAKDNEDSYTSTAAKAIGVPDPADQTKFDDSRGFNMNDPNWKKLEKTMGSAEKTAIDFDKKHSKLVSVPMAAASGLIAGLGAPWGAIEGGLAQAAKTGLRTSSAWKKTGNAALAGAANYWKGGAEFPYKTYKNVMGEESRADIIKRVIKEAIKPKTGVKPGFKIAGLHPFENPKILKMFSHGEKTSKNVDGYKIRDYEGKKYWINDKGDIASADVEVNLNKKANAIVDAESIGQQTGGVGSGTNSTKLSPYLTKQAEKLKGKPAGTDLSNLPRFAGEPVSKFKIADVAPELPISGKEPQLQKAPAKETKKPLPFADKPKPVEFKIADVAPEPPMPGKEPQLQKAPSKSAPPSLPFADKPKPVEFKIADVQPAAQTTVLTRPEIETKVKPATQAQTTVLTRPEIETKTKAKPAAQTTVLTRPEIETKVKPAETKTKNPPPEKPPGKRRKFPFGLPGLTPGQGSSFYQDSNVPVDIYKHMPKEYMNFEQTRYDVENVARPNSKDKVKARSRQAEIVTKIIEEKKASKKKTSTVIINPKLKQEEPEQTQ